MKDLGRYQLYNMLSSAEAHTWALFTRFLEWQPTEIQALLGELRRELQDRSVHSYEKFYYVYGQKPE